MDPNLDLPLFRQNDNPTSPNDLQADYQASKMPVTQIHDAFQQPPAANTIYQFNRPAEHSFQDLPSHPHSHAIPFSTNSQGSGYLTNFGAPSRETSVSPGLSPSQRYVPQASRPGKSRFPGYVSIEKDSKDSSTH
jgi:hypothetical protein